MAKSYGLGDLVEEILDPFARALGLKNCAGCKKRKEALNRLGKKKPCATCGDTRPKKR